MSLSDEQLHWLLDGIKRDLVEERPRVYKRELFGASSEARDADQLGLFNEAGALAPNVDAVPARGDGPQPARVGVALPSFG